ncbi:MAG: tRNA (adenosine(37)-N6)-dimethylallyltransferase MiaA [Desulfarculus sp.]|nr:MAG: tRNA (adenosine(37)-N6)-dimethylallyltransferase MiaA [Desulfarculus sp.]
MPPALLVLVGPTAVGKTGLALRLARELDAEVVSADSVQIYRGLDIGSAKPSPAERAQVRHHLIDVAEPEESFSAARYAALADQAIAEITARNRRVLVAGGTGLYIKALLHGLAPAPAVDPALRARLREEWDRQGPQALHQRLAQADPATARRLHPHDRQRILRALEVCLQSSRPFSESQAAHGFRPARYPHLYLGLERPRPELNRRIEERSRQMWAGGLLEEVQGLLAGGLGPSAPGLKSLGYCQALAVLQKQMTPAQALEDMIKKTKAYSKRQLTWFRGLKGLHWHSPQDVQGVLARAGEFLAGIEVG